MTKKRSQRKKKRKNRQAARKPSRTAVNEVVERMLAAGPDYIEENLIRLMQDSATLRQEPEFVDLSFDPRQTLEAAARHFPRFKRRLLRAANRDGENVPTIHDDFRIAVLDDLVTPEFEQELKRRLARCTTRLNRGHDVDKTEIALFLSMFLEDETREMLGGKKRVSLGLYGLVTTIYEESFDRAMAEIPEARDIIGETLYTIWCARHQKEDMALIDAAVEQIDDFEDFADRVAADPALGHAWLRQEQYLFEEFQEHVTTHGLNVEPPLFTPEESTRPMTMMEQRYWNKPWSLSRYFVIPAVVNFMRCILEVVDEIVSPEKIAQIREVLQALGHTCLHADEEQVRRFVPPIQAAIDQLQPDGPPSENSVVTTLYLMSLTAAIDEESLGPRWRWFFERAEKSRLMQSYRGPSI
ncbi:MAG: hypothetical protein PVH17_11870 [Anaerolineae bacterium]|jgi:hypothetical protein